jgi:hypothetical protein
MAEERARMHVLRSSKSCLPAKSSLQRRHSTGRSASAHATREGASASARRESDVSDDEGNAMSDSHFDVSVCDAAADMDGERVIASWLFEAELPP